MPPSRLPILETDRLILRPFEISDAPRVALLAGDREIAANTLRIPHPYKEEEAVEFIQSVGKEILKGRVAVFAIVEKTENLLIGSIGLELKKEHECAEMGYWIGKPYWGQGYCTESARKVLEYGFQNLKLHKIYAHYMDHNPASGRIMEKIGMIHEGTLREHVKKWDKFITMHLYAILRDEYFGQNKDATRQ